LKNLWEHKIRNWNLPCVLWDAKEMVKNSSTNKTFINCMYERIVNKYRYNHERNAMSIMLNV
jgi:hypothetical protein